MTDTRVTETPQDDTHVTEAYPSDFYAKKVPTASGDGFARALNNRTAEGTPSAAGMTTGTRSYGDAWDEPAADAVRTAPVKSPFVWAVLWLGAMVCALILAADPYFEPITGGVLGRDGTGLMGWTNQAGVRAATAIVIVLPLLVAVLLGARSTTGRAVGIVTTVVAGAAFYIEPSPGVRSTWWIPALGVVIAYSGWLVARDRKALSYLTIVPVAAAAVAWNDATGWARELRHLTDELPWNVYTFSVGWAYLALPIVVGLCGLLAAAAGRRDLDDLDDLDEFDRGVFR